MKHGHGHAESLIARTSREASQEELQHWMARVMEGDASALEALYRAMYGRLCAFLLRGYVRSEADAEDIVEETFLKIWMNRDRLRVRGSVANYLTITVRNKALNQRERQRVEAKYATAPPADTPWAERVAVNEGEVSIHNAEIAERVERAIDALPARTRETYCLYYHHHLTYAEIAEAMGVSVRTVEAQLVRAVRNLTKQLGNVLS